MILLGFELFYKKYIVYIKNYSKIVITIIKRMFFLLSPAYYYCEMGTYWLRLNKIEKSLQDFKKSEELNIAGNSDLSMYNWVHLGYGYFDIGDYETAKVYLERIYYYDSTDAEVIYRLAKCYESLNLVDNAFFYYSQAVESDKNDFWYPLEATVLAIEKEMGNEANKFIGAAKNRAKSEIENIIASAWELRIKNDKAGALKLLEKVLFLIDLDENKEYINYKTSVVIFYYNLLKENANGNFSLDIFEKNLLANLKDPFLNFILAKEYCDRNINLEKALRMINVAIDFGKVNVEYHNLKGLILYKLGQVELAQKVVKNNLEFSPGNEKTLELLKKIGANK
jgi:tetratricopeptide (TPR) repeat protein